MTYIEWKLQQIERNKTKMSEYVEFISKNIQTGRSKAKNNTKKAKMPPLPPKKHDIRVFNSTPRPSFNIGDKVYLKNGFFIPAYKFPVKGSEFECVGIIANIYGDRAEVAWENGACLDYTMKYLEPAGDKVSSKPDPNHEFRKKKMVGKISGVSTAKVNKTTQADSLEVPDLPADYKLEADFADFWSTEYIGNEDYDIDEVFEDPEGN